MSQVRRSNPFYIASWGFVRGWCDFEELSKLARSLWVDAMGGVGGDGDRVAAGGAVPLGGLVGAAGVSVCAGYAAAGDDGGVGAAGAGVGGGEWAPVVGTRAIGGSCGGLRGWRRSRDRLSYRCGGRMGGLLRGSRFSATAPAEG